MVSSELEFRRQYYNWKRFWCPRTGNTSLSDGGYLSDPDSKWGHIHNPNVLSFEKISNTPCLALLGEPGMGKSYAMQHEKTDLEYGIKEKGDELIYLDLRSYGSEDRLVKNLFGSAAFVSWAKGKHRLHLFLDSLDECLLRIDTLAMLLPDELRRYQVNRLNLRIACRTADWPDALENSLKEMWGNDGVKVYELAPLRRADVVEAVKSNKLDPDIFLKDVERMEVVPLAIKPVTLQFLINSFLRTGCLPSNQAELYRQGCRILCEETSESRRSAGRIGSFTAEQRMAVSARIAAVTVFANRYAIWTAVAQGDVPEEDIPISELSIGNEFINDLNVQVTDAGVKETLDTGLFSSRGLGRMGWAHQSYAEFLAAYFMVQRQMNLTQIMSLLVHPGDPDGKIIPQLHETAAWLASLNPEVFRALMNVDPEILLRSDIATAEPKDRAELVEILLKFFDQEKLIDRFLELHQHYRKLDHPGLAQQLRPYLCESNKGNIVRRVTVDIAEACQRMDLQGDLLDIGLNREENIVIRREAIGALSAIADSEFKSRLKSLAINEIIEDSDDTLKGEALSAVWPLHISAADLFSALTPPKEKDFIGKYHMFLSHELVEHLHPPDFYEALKWVEKQNPRRYLPYPFQKLLQKILIRAWDNLSSPDLIGEFAKAVLSRLEKDYTIVEGKEEEEFNKKILENDHRRHQVVESMLSLLGGSEKDITDIAYTSFAPNKDFSWMVNTYMASSPGPMQSALGELVVKVFDSREQDHFETIYKACQLSPHLAKKFDFILEPIQLDSAKAKKLKEEYDKRQKYLENRERPLLDPPPKDRISALLTEIESGNSSAWWRLNLDLTLKPNSHYYGDEHISDLTNLPGWREAEILTQKRIVKAAQKYLLEQGANTEQWLGKDILHHPALAGYRAFRLLMKEDPVSFSALEPKIWGKWASIILAYPEYGKNADEREHHELIRKAYEIVPEDIIGTLMILIDKENRDRDFISVLKKVDKCWDDRLKRVVLAKAKDERMKHSCMEDLLNSLLERKFPEARSFAESLVKSPVPRCGRERIMAIVGAQALVKHAEDAGWPVVWGAIEQDATFGQEVISKIGRDTGKFWARLTEDQLAELYIWLAHQFPHSEDPDHRGAHWLGPRDQIAGLRDSVLNHIKGRGTPQSCEVISRIVKEFPELGWLKWVLLEAQDNTRHRTWAPPKPRDILELARNSESRLVQNGDQLLDVLIESFGRLEAKLQGETPAAIDLWNEMGKNIYRPKDENRLSDYVKRHLEDDLKKKGVIVNREVEIRRGEGKRRGEQTDIHVDATIKGGEVYDSVTIIIETKGCWHRELKNAMKTQLADRYLKDNHCQYGLYLVGWFNCDQWDNEDDRKSHSSKGTLAEARKNFSDQANGLSSPGTRIKSYVLNAALR